MNLIRLCIERPIAVIAAMIMVVMFGIVALQNIPIQLTPDVNRPVISVTTVWPGAAPAEVETLLGDPTKAREQLGWVPEVDFDGLVDLMVDADMERYDRLKAAHLL